MDQGYKCLINNYILQVLDPGYKGLIWTFSKLTTPHPTSMT